MYTRVSLGVFLKHRRRRRQLLHTKFPVPWIVPLDFACINYTRHSFLSKHPFDPYRYSCQVFFHQCFLYQSIDRIRARFSAILFRKRIHSACDQFVQHQITTCQFGQQFIGWCGHNCRIVVGVTSFLVPQPYEFLQCRTQQPPKMRGEGETIVT
jgi:hypothetical protein